MKKINEIVENDTNHFKQDFINNRLQDICKILKTIPEISFNYLEYMASLIYFMCKNSIYLSDILDANIEKILYDIDYELDVIRHEEQSNRLFTNISFKKVITKKHYNTFTYVLNNLTDLILDLENYKSLSKSILAEAFDYIIMCAAQNGEIFSNNGEFYTPKGVVKTILKLLNLHDNISIYNPCSLTGNFITEASKIAKIYAFLEESSLSNYNICMTSLWLHDVFNKKFKENYDNEVPLVDAIIANPPFAGNINDNFETNYHLPYIYNKYYISKYSNSYIKFLAMMIERIHINGKMAIILPHGFLFKKNKSDYLIRKDFVDKNYLEAIIGLPEKLFYATKLPVVIVVINKYKRRDGVLFVDASKEYSSKRKTNILTEKHQDKIANVYKNFSIIPNYSYVATFNEIEKNNYDLTIKKYVYFNDEVKNINPIYLKEHIRNLEYKQHKLQRQIDDLIKSTDIDN